MEDFETTLAINSQQIPARVHPYVNDDKTYYEVVTDDFTLTIYKDTLYTWTSDDSTSFSQAEIQTIGEQLILQ